MLAEPLLQEANRRAVAQRGVAATPVVERLDVLEQVGLRVGAGRVRRAVHPLVFEAVEEALGRRVVPAVALATHRCGHAEVTQLGRHGGTCVLTSAIAVKHDSSLGLAPEPRHGQGIGDDVRGHARFDRPADDLAVEQIEDDGQVQPALAGLDVRDIPRPDSIRRLGCEVTRQQIRRDGQRMPGVRRRLESSLVACPDAVLAHESFHPPQADAMAAPLQLAVHAPRAVGSLELGVDAAHQRQGLRIAQAGAIGLAAAAPGAVAADAHAEHLAQLRQGMVAALRVDPRVLHSASLAKYAVAFFKMSTCIRSRAFSALSRDSSICSGVTGFAPAPARWPAWAAFTQLRSVCSTSPSSRAAAPTPTAWACLTAWSLNSAVYCCFGIVFTSSRPSGLDATHRLLEDEKRQAAQ